MLTGTIESCANCKWFECFIGVCCNGDSDHCADFVGESEWCDEWEADVHKHMEEMEGKDG